MSLSVNGASSSASVRGKSAPIGTLTGFPLPLDKVCTSIDGVRHWLWSAVDEHDFVQGILLHRHRDPEAAKIFLIGLFGGDDVSDVLPTDQLRSSGAAIRAMPSLLNVDHQRVMSTARCTHTVDQRASVTGHAVLSKTRSTSHTTSRTTIARIETAKTSAGISKTRGSN